MSHWYVTKNSACMNEDHKGNSISVIFSMKLDNLHVVDRPGVGKVQPTAWIQPAVNSIFQQPLPACLGPVSIATPAATAL